MISKERTRAILITALTLAACANEGGRPTGALGGAGADGGEECITPFGDPCGIAVCEDPCDYNSPELLAGECVIEEAPEQCDEARGFSVALIENGGVVAAPGGFFKPKDADLQRFVERRWQNLADYTVPAAVKSKLTAGGVKIWNYPDGADYNRGDFFAGIMTLPDGKTPESLLRELLNDPVGTAGSDGDFGAWVGWPKSNNRQLGDRVDLDIWGPDNGAVGYFRIASDEFCVITLENASVGTHPVSGVRCWGWEPMTINPNWMDEAGCRWSWSKPAFMIYSVGLDSANVAGSGWAGQQMQEGTWSALIKDLLRRNDAAGGVSGRWVLYKTEGQPSTLKPGSGVKVVGPGNLNAWKIGLPSDGYREAETCSDPETPAGQCAANEFTCSSGACIPDSQRCDGVSQCADRDDEDACDGTDMPGGDTSEACPGQWACADGSCIPSDWRCDGEYSDCAGGEDEQSCDGSDMPDDPDQPDDSDPTGTCGNSEFSCNDGTCIPASWQCDEIVDCAASEDETGCDTGGSSGGSDSCDGFQCPGGECIVAEWVCDDIVDCSGGEDEADC